MAPHTGKFVAYYRVSTKRQGASGLGLEGQKKSVQDHLNGGDWELLAEFTEVESGRRTDRHRPELKRALAMCAETGATIIVAKLDRLTRNVGFLAKIIDSAVPMIACDIPDMGNPAQTRFMLQLLANVAEFEAANISSRTKSALAAAKARGQQLGSPDPGAGAKHAGKFVANRADQFALEVGPIIEELEEYGCVTLEQIANGLAARGVATSQDNRDAQGKPKWALSAVANIRRRYQAVK